MITCFVCHAWRSFEATPAPDDGDCITYLGRRFALPQANMAMPRWGFFE